VFVPDSCEADQLLDLECFLKPNKSIQPVLLQSIYTRTQNLIHGSSRHSISVLFRVLSH